MGVDAKVGAAGAEVTFPKTERVGAGFAAGLGPKALNPDGLKIFGAGTGDVVLDGKKALAAPGVGALVNGSEPVSKLEVFCGF